MLLEKHGVGMWSGCLYRQVHVDNLLNSWNCVYLFSNGLNFVSGMYCISSGNETKMGMSRGIPEPKLTAMDAMIDKLTGAIFIFQIVVVLVLGIAGNVWKETEAKKVCYSFST